MKPSMKSTNKETLNEIKNNETNKQIGRLPPPSRQDMYMLHIYIQIHVQIPTPIPIPIPIPIRIMYLYKYLYLYLYLHLYLYLYLYQDPPGRRLVLQDGPRGHTAPHPSIKLNLI